MKPFCACSVGLNQITKSGHFVVKQDEAHNAQVKHDICAQICMTPSTILVPFGGFVKRPVMCADKVLHWQAYKRLLVFNSNVVLCQAQSIGFRHQC